MTVYQALQDGLQEAFKKQPFFALREQRLQSILTRHLDQWAKGATVQATVSGLPTSNSVAIGLIQEEVRPSDYQMLDSFTCSPLPKAGSPKRACFDIVVMSAEGSPVPLTLGGARGGDVIRALPLSSMRAVIEVKAGPFPAIKEAVFSDLCRLLELAERHGKECHFVFADKLVSHFCKKLGVDPKPLQQVTWNQALDTCWPSLVASAGCERLRGTKLEKVSEVEPTRPGTLTIHVVGDVGDALGFRLCRASAGNNAG